MPKTTLRKVEAACAFLVLLHALAPGVAAQRPRVQKDVTRAERAGWREVLRWPEACEQSFEAYAPEGETDGGLAFYRLGRGRYLVEVTCDVGGIQPSVFFMLYHGGRARALRLRGFDESEEGIRALTKFDDARRELSLMSKADAMGTCGLFVRYSFRGARPRVVEARRQDDCGGARGTPDTSRWPRVRL